MRSVAADLRAQPRFNYHPSPKADTSGSGVFFAANGATITRPADTRLGTPFCVKVDFPSGGVADSGINVSTGITPASIGGVGRPFTLAFDITADIVTTLRFSRQGGSSSGSPINEAFTIPAGGITRKVFTFSTATANALSLYVLRSVAGQTGSIYLSNFMLTDGTYTGPFRSGDSPGWKWRGAVGASASVGWPS